MPPPGPPALVRAVAPAAPLQAMAGPAIQERQGVTAAKILGALQALVAQPLRSLRSIGDDVGLGRASINKHIAPGGQCRKLDALVSYSDYHLHAQAIQDALRSLGHDGQADELASLGQVAKRARLAHGPRPQAAAQSHHFDAHKLAQALQYFQRREAARADGKFDDETLLRSVDEVVGVKARMVSAWVTTAGKLAKPPESIARLPGYLERREEIQKLLVDFGHTESAQSLPDFVPLRQAVSAASLARALEILADGPDRSMRAAELASGLARSVLNNYLLGANNDLFAKTGSLPDYDLHSDAMRASLQRIGRQDLADVLPATAPQRMAQQAAPGLIPWPAHVFLERAGGNMHKIEATARLIRAGIPMLVATKQARAHKALILPLLDDKGALRSPSDVENVFGSVDRPAARRIRDLMAMLAKKLDPVPARPATQRMVANDFLDRATSALNAVVAAAQVLRAEPALSRGDAARSVGASRSVVRALLDERGGVRHPHDVESVLDGVDGAASQRLEKLVGRLAERLGEAPFAEAAATPMRRLTLHKGMFGKPRVLIVDAHTQEPGRDKKESVYRQNPGLVREPRSFAHDRHRQPLRWLSTLLKDQFPGSFEVQCYFDAANRQIIASTNRTFLNKRIEDFVHSGKLAEMLAGPAQKLASPQTDRSERHFAKLSGRMNPAADPHPTGLSDAVLAAIAEGRIQVTTRDYREDGVQVTLHAERRIFDHLEHRLGQNPELSNLAGTMRPCGDCAEEIGAGPDVHRGPFFASKAAGAMTDSQDNRAGNERDGIGTSVTRARNGRLTFGHDTDSDSDADFSHESDLGTGPVRTPPKAGGAKRKGLAVGSATPMEGSSAAGRPPAWPGDDFDWGRYFRQLGGGEPPPDMEAPHAHHIVFKSGRSAQMREYIGESKAILVKHDIDWLWGRENLIWAPNKNHSKAAAKAVRDALVEADKTGSRDAVADALARLGRHFADRTITTLYE